MGKHSVSYPAWIDTFMSVVVIGYKFRVVDPVGNIRLIARVMKKTPVRVHDIIEIPWTPLKSKRGIGVVARVSRKY
jgi:hypothetical protein